MSADVHRLYQSLILEHGRRPRNRRAIAAAHRVESRNPACGDSLIIYLHIEGDVILDASFEGSGCAISTASASLMTEHLKGKTIVEAAALADRMHEVLTGSDAAVTHDDLSVLAAVRHFPARVECAELAWRTLLVSAGR